MSRRRYHPIRCHTSKHSLSSVSVRRLNCWARSQIVPTIPGYTDRRRAMSERRPRADGLPRPCRLPSSDERRSFDRREGCRNNGNDEDGKVCGENVVNTIVFRKLYVCSKGRIIASATSANTTYRNIMRSDSIVVPCIAPRSKGRGSIAD